MQEIITFVREYRYIIVPFLVWLGIQLFKFFYDIIKEKRFNFKRLMQAVVVSLTTMIAKAEGIASPLFGVSLIFAFIVMYDAAGVRRAAGKQAKLLNKIVETPGLSGVEVSEKLVEVLGHTPVQVIVGAVIGLAVGIII